MTPDVIEQVAVAIGQILHQGTGKPVDGSISIRALEVPIHGTFLEDGNFAVSTWPDMYLPDLAAQAYQLTLTIRADSQQFIEGFYETEVVVPVPAGSTFEPPIDLGILELMADPLCLGGRVVEAQNPDTVISNATIDLIRGGTTVNTTQTDTEGRYRFDLITVLPDTDIKCSAPNFTDVQRKLSVDFGKLLSEEYFQLPPI
jgi:hypothetical protein